MQFESLVTKVVPKIICIGKNYMKHVMEMGGSQVPKEPVVFLKPWSSLSFDPKELSLPSALNHRIDHELELGVVIGKPGKLIPKKQAMGHVAGYFIGLDLTDRDLQAKAKQAGLPWTIAKGQDGFCPVSKMIEDIDPYSVQLELIVNGQQRQKDIANNMHFRIDEIISFVSGAMTLSQGDLILTGTPNGVGPIKVGDTVEAFGRVSQKVVAQLKFTVLP